MGRFTLTIDTDDFGGNVSSKLSRALRNAASRVEHGCFEFGTTFNVTVDGTVVGEYRHIAKRRTRFTNTLDDNQGHATGMQPELVRAFAKLLPMGSQMASAIVPIFGANKVKLADAERIADEIGKCNVMTIRRANGEQAIQYQFEDGSQFELGFGTLDPADREALNSTGG